MINLLLADTTLIVGICIIVACVCLAVFIGVRVRKQTNGNYKTAIDFDKIDGKSQLVRHINYLWPKELEVYQLYQSLLPKEYMIVPKVGVDKIVKPHGSLVLFNAVKSKYVDFCIFKVSNMEPIMVLDCYYPSITDSTVKELDKATKVALKSVDIPVVKFEILDTPYDKAQLLQSFLDLLDPVALAQLRKQSKK